MRIIIAAFLIAGFPCAASAADSMAFANNLGMMLASEGPCDLSFKQSAIEALIQKKVSAEDLGFTSMLQMMTSGSEIQIGEMSPSAKTAHCSQIRRSAKAYGFID